ncbi:hypothetical protein VKT23_002888 [Stygiomarasmius scandens]|uniref:Uncharacterized protein n=1 Tax=Marasmiellus scandens TaxID=2682957 RepID=A0ABR1JVG7_9AGAR
MSATARAEARRKAILSRGNDRLSKLTNSARGDDPAYKHDDPPLPSFSSSTSTTTSTFLGEETNMPTPPLRASPSPAPNAPSNKSTSSPPGPEPGVWSQEQQQFLQALMGGVGGAEGAGMGMGGMDANPLAALLMAGLNGGAGAGTMPALPGTGSMGTDGKSEGIPPLMPPGFPNMAGTGPGMPPGAMMATEPPKPKTLLQRLMPLIHLVAMWALLAYFAFFQEPKVYEETFGATSVSGSGWQGVWTRWGELAKRNPLSSSSDSLTGESAGWTVAALPFFYAFISLQIGLHSIRIFSGFDKPQLPSLLSIALPHLPAPIPSIVVNGAKYLQMASAFFDDFALVAVGMGFLVWIAGYLSE